MTEIDKFINIIRANSDQGVPVNIGQAKKIISEINNFLYTTHADLGVINISGENYQYFSLFHKYWHEHYKDILNLQISDTQCEKVATALHEVYQRTNGNAFRKIYDTRGLSHEAICRVRLLSANQDFRGSRKFSELADCYTNDPSIFDENNIANDPEDFLKQIGIQKLSQTDKRIIFAQNIAKFILDHKKAPYDIINDYNRNVSEFRRALIEISSGGYGNKKADMFIRDMVVLGIWSEDKISGFDQIDVASDVNTIKVALRTGIFTSEIPLLSSFLDIFGDQYSYVDKINANAWRRVFELWRSKFPNECIASPCLLDYFIYNVIGKQLCKKNLYVFNGVSCNHTFRWHSAQNRTCQECYRKGEQGKKATLVEKLMLCSDNEGHIAMKQTDFYKSKMANPQYDTCPFKSICDSYNKKFLMPPKSISIMGQTGWTSGYANSEEGGGGLMA